MKFARLIIFSLFVLLSACAGKPLNTVVDNNWQLRQQQMSKIEQWTVKGRIGVKTPEQGFTSNLSWQHLSDKQQFRIYGSFGKTYAELIQSATGATLELSDKEIYQSTDVEQLLHQVLGYPLPIEHLEYWILGLPYPGNDSDLTFDKSGHLQTISYQQWKISYKKYKRFASFDGLYLPSKITVTDGEVTLRLSLRDWSMDTNL